MTVSIFKALVVFLIDVWISKHVSDVLSVYCLLYGLHSGDVDFVWSC